MLYQFLIDNWDQDTQAMICAWRAARFLKIADLAWLLRVGSIDKQMLNQLRVEFVEDDR